jgi:phenylpropionate dioxygenase-like ring-hydroxylating dioxygenase large terminal subunit
MKSNIPAFHYHEPGVFARERSALFQSGWNFVGFRQQIAQPNDFITRTIADVPVVVQNTRGKVKAFLNVCSHRFCAIQSEQSGNRPLLCPYHGWAYDGEGIPTGIPKKPLFKEFTTDELKEMRLKEFQLDFCGNLAFVRLSGINAARVSRKLL